MQHNRVRGHAVLGEQEEELSDENEEETVIGVDTSECGEQCTIVVGKIKAVTDSQTPVGRSLTQESVERFFAEDRVDKKGREHNRGILMSRMDAKASWPSFTGTVPDSLPDTISGRPPKAHTPRVPSQPRTSTKGTKPFVASHKVGPRPKGPQAKPRKNGEANGVHNASAKSGKEKDKRKAVIKRLSTTDFQEYRQKEEDEGRVGIVVGGAWSKMAIVRIQRRNEPKVRQCSCIGLTWVLSTFRRTETADIADLESQSEGGCVPLKAYGPYRSEYGRLGEFPNLPPLLIIATGAGAALALDFIAYVRANKLTPVRSVSVCYSSASLALLQFVTNTLLAESIPGISIRTALTRHDDLEVFDTAAGNEEELSIGRLDVKSIVAEASSDTEVYFCGGGGINNMLRTVCATRGMKYVGSSVQ